MAFVILLVLVYKFGCGTSTPACALALRFSVPSMLFLCALCGNSFLFSLFSFLPYLPTNTNAPQ